jgi:hypothetical protein
MLKDIVQTEREQEADCERIDAAVRLAGAAIAALAGSDEVHQRRCAIRDRIILSVADVRRNIRRRAEGAKKTRKELIETFFLEGATNQSRLDYSVVLHDMPTNELMYHLQYLNRTRELDRVHGVYHAFQNRADRHPYIGAFDEIAEGALADSGPELAKRLAKICRLADETDAKLADLWFRHVNPETQNGNAHEAEGESQPDTTAGSSPSSMSLPARESWE